MRWDAMQPGRRGIEPGFHDDRLDATVMVAMDLKTMIAIGFRQCFRRLSFKKMIYEQGKPTPLEVPPLKVQANPTGLPLWAMPLRRLRP